MLSHGNRSLTYYLVGPNASLGQLTTVLVPALFCAIGCAALTAQQGASDWVIAVAFLLAFDVVGGCIACSLPPLQALHASMYRRPILRALFQIGHCGHVLILAVLLANTAFIFSVVGIALLVSGASCQAILSHKLLGGLRALVVLAWIAFVLTQPNNPLVLEFLSIVLFLKLFVAFPSFEGSRGHGEPI
jgi:hypothetical protein